MPVLLGRDLLRCATVAAMLSILLARAYLAVAAGLALAAIACFAQPTSAELVFAVATGSMLVAAGLIERRLTLRAGDAPRGQD